MAFIYCGIDLAVRRKTAVGVMEGREVSVNFVKDDEEIVELCKDSRVSAIDSPLSPSRGFRQVDREMLRRGLKVLPPSFMESLVVRALRLSKHLRLIETHPTSSEKLMGLDWRSFTTSKDEFDAVICSLTAFFYDMGKALKVSADDGEIYLIDFKVGLSKRGGKYVLEGGAY
ncbi:MAG: DUF429 domain-containing protein [Candidatus Aramenus sulfurataquae]|uniref:DUF429 domain-containing protein n=2 Tax=Candidatus Aramenus sulfurataquae TaxID=1326980 RepID=A0AAE3FL98_9CREN|nr:DUF429 domain-containing protein [Candidatus Aramenus sulfurataquae]